MSEIRIGCCGFGMAKKKYFKEFNTVELQKTFYQPPKKISTVQKWHEQSPRDFEYTLKAWQLITHTPSSPTYRRLGIDLEEPRKKNYGSFQPTDEVFKAWEKTDEMASILKTKLIVFQCPTSFKPSAENKENMREFFNSIDRKNYIFVWEPRGEWEDDEIKQICKELDLVHCVDPFKAKSVYGKVNYYRLHGKTGYKYQYTDEDLKELKERLANSSCLRQSFGGQAKLKAYVMFNNMSMVQDALRFKRLIYK